MGFVTTRIKYVMLIVRCKKKMTKGQEGSVVGEILVHDEMRKIGASGCMKHDCERSRWGAMAKIVN